MNTLYYDAYSQILNKLDLQSIANLLNTNNKLIYETIIKYCRNKKIYRDIIRYDVCRFARFGKRLYPKEEYGYLFRESIKNGCNIHVLEYIKSEYMISQKKNKSIWPKSTFTDAIKNSSLDIMKWFKDNGCPFDEDTFREAVGNLEKMIWLKDNGCHMTNYCYWEAVRKGNLQMMTWLKENGCELDKYAFSIAAKQDNIEIMKWLKENGCPMDKETFKCAAEHGNLTNMIWLKENGCPWSSYTFWMAARYGNLENIIWLKENGCEWDTYTFSYVVQNGNLKNIKWFFENGCPYDDKEVFSHAMESKIKVNINININININEYEYPLLPKEDLIMMNYLFEKKILNRDGQYKMSKAIENNWSLEGIKWLFDKGVKLDKYSFALAARYGKLEIMKWLADNKYEIDAYTFACATRYGDLEIMKWFKEICNSPWDTRTFTVAAGPGKREKSYSGGGLLALIANTDILDIYYENDMPRNIETMKWLLENGCPWNTYTFASATEHGDLNNMKWLLDNGCPMDDDSFSIAVYNKKINYEILNWLRDNKCPMSIDTFYKAAFYDNIELLKWLHLHGCPNSHHTLQRIIERDGSFETVQWLIEIGCELNADIFNTAIKRKDNDILKLLQDNNCEHDYDSIYLAERSGDQELLQWLKS